MEEFNQFYYRLQCILDHTIPALALLIDYGLLNSVPYVRRHLSVSWAVGVVYTVSNMITTLYSGSAVYPFMTWKGVGGWVGAPVGIAVGIGGIFWCLEWLTKKKLKALG